MHWPKDLLNAILGWIRNNEKQQEERRSARRTEIKRMNDLAISANNLYTGTFPPDENRLKDTLMELRPLAQSQNDPQLGDAVEELIDAIQSKEIKSSVRTKTERVIKILSDNIKQI